eukprot:CAMPEP_0170167278 /NCGR_PEP_ID=MMETSP0040_2-20121228/727_1 /TAXON_ID=641309 /ORGANISM="Lotharella oceanica, Strain CCMP622" /LENGTH=155 /DNA_ID=CAMNT_0010405255 /DNA_START=540 /DNA_END=1007 /DNA_ORIENTATION=+
MNTVSDVFWSYTSKERCWQRGKDATFFIPQLKRFYYVSISKKDDHFHLAVLWLPTTEEAAKEIKNLSMSLKMPLSNGQSIVFNVKPPKMHLDLNMDENVRKLIRERETYIVPIRKWRSQFRGGKHYFRISSKWSREDPDDKMTVTAADDATDDEW